VSIGESAFSCNFCLRYICGNNLEKIEKTAFEQCRVLRGLKIPKLTTLHEYTFAGCYCLN
jgi:hypothetical protein